MPKEELDLSIDLFNLEKEWADQPELRRKYGHLQADANRDLAEAKADLSVVEAEIATAVRKDPGTFGLTKLTESVVKETIPIQSKHKDAVDEVIAAKHRVDILDAAVSAIDHRKKALEKEVELFIANYFAKPRSPEGAKEKMEQATAGKVRRRGRRSEEK